MTSEPCPDDDALAAYVDGRLGADDLERVSAHLVECHRCYQSVAAAVRFFRGPRRVEDAAPPGALFPAMATAVAMAVFLTICLLLLERAP